MYEVMLVEDDRALRYVYSKMKVWENSGFRIGKEVANGLEAVEWVKEHSVDVIFTDIRMPFMNGIEMMKQIQREHSDILFVFVSSYNEFEYAREGLRMGAVDYLVKPLEEKDVEGVLKRLQTVLSNQSKDQAILLLQKFVQQEVNWEEPILQNMCKIFDAHKDKNLTLEEVALELNLSKDYLGKLVKSYTGMGFRALYNGYKMEYAKPFIKSGKYKVYEISEMLGYTSADYFTQLFKNSTGMTPAEYKKG